MWKLVTVTGPIAAGATTLARKLAETMKWEQEFEDDVEKDSPFFSLFHSDPQRYSFHNQVVFLARSAERHLRLRERAHNGMIYIQDFTPFEHTGVYAQVQHQQGILTAEELSLLQRLTNVVQQTFITPSVLVYRPLPNELLMRRVQGRNRPSEQALEIEYLAAISQRFEDWAKHWTISPIIRVDEDLDVFEDTERFNQLTSALRSSLSLLVDQ